MQFYHMCNCMYPPPQLGYRTVPSPWDSSLPSLLRHSQPQLPPTLTSLTPGNLPISIIVISQMFYKWNCTVWTLLELAFFHSTLFPWGSLKLLCISIVYSFLLLSSIPWYWCTKICLTIHSLENIWVVASLELLLELLWIFLYKFLNEHSFYFSELR